jgi:hypothetical protein
MVSHERCSGLMRPPSPKKSELKSPVCSSVSIQLPSSSRTRITSRCRQKKGTGLESLPSQLSGFSDFTSAFSTGDGSNGDDGGGSTDVRRTSSTTARNTSRSTDTVGNSHRGNTHNSPDSLQPQFRPKPERQNLAPKQKPIPLLPLQLREPFSNSLFTSPMILTPSY